MKEELSAAFTAVAEAAGVPLTEETADEVVVSLNGYTIRALHRPERLEGTYVTLAFRGSREYALLHLVKFKCEPSSCEEEARMVQSGNFQNLAALTIKYALPYLLGHTTDFADFEAFVAAEVKAQVAQTPAYKATKWVRPEWL